MQSDIPINWEFHTHSITSFVRPFVAESWSRGWNIHSLSARPNRNLSIHATSLLAPVNVSRKLVVTVHDLVPLTHPETLTLRGSLWHEKMLKRVVESAASIVVPTHAIENSLRTHFSSHNLDGRVFVAGGASSLPIPDDTDRSLIPRQKYIVFLGTIEPRKRVDALIAAVSKLRDISLVVIGNNGWGDVNVTSLAQFYGLPPDRFHHVSNATDQQVSNLISDAQALILPSEAEGFGLPLVEAMSLGTPIIYSDDPALSEVASNVGIKVKRNKSTDIFASQLADAIEEISENSDRYRAAGIEHSAQYSWAKTAKEIWQIHRGLD